LWKIHPAFNWNSSQHLTYLFYGELPKNYAKKKQEYSEYFVHGTKKKKTTKKFKTLEEYIQVFENTEPFRKLSTLNIKTTATGFSTDNEMQERIREAIIKRIDALLNLKRKLNLNYIRKLNKKLNIPLEALISEYETEGVRT
jgi:hypothetical protein